METNNMTEQEIENINLMLQKMGFYEDNKHNYLNRQSVLTIDYLNNFNSKIKTFVRDCEYGVEIFQYCIVDNYKDVIIDINHLKG